ncbi:hypothetical protein R6Q59_035283 [Mikania micrantha]
MGTNEVNIFRELEKDVERDLEEEIKDGIYHLALRLHRLYQHQKERTSKIYETALSEANTKEQEAAKNKILSELNINIRMENGTKIEIKETKDGITQVSPRRRRSTTVNVTRATGPWNKKKFNWESTLRSDPIINKSENSTNKIKSVKKDDKNSNPVVTLKMENILTKKNLLKAGFKEKNIWAP